MAKGNGGLFDFILFYLSAVGHCRVSRLTMNYELVVVMFLISSSVNSNDNTTVHKVP